MACWLYEGMLLFAVVFVAGWLFSTLGQMRDAMDSRRHLLQAFLFVVFGVYFVWFWSKGQTLAMKTWGIRVVDRYGRPLTQGRALLRYLLQLDLVPAAAGRHRALQAARRRNRRADLRLGGRLGAAGALSSRAPVLARRLGRHPPDPLQSAARPPMTLAHAERSQSTRSNLHRQSAEVAHAASTASGTPPLSRWTACAPAGARPPSARKSLCAIVLLPAAFWVGRSWVEIALLAGAVLLVLIVELLNTAIEAAIDRIGPGMASFSKRAKDMGSAAVLLSMLLCGGVWLAALWQRFAPETLGFQHMMRHDPGMTPLFRFASIAARAPASARNSRRWPQAVGRWIGEQRRPAGLRRRPHRPDGHGGRGHARRRRPRGRHHPAGPGRQGTGQPAVRRAARGRHHARAQGHDGRARRRLPGPARRHRHLRGDVRDLDLAPARLPRQAGRHPQRRRATTTACSTSWRTACARASWATGRWG